MTALPRPTRSARILAFAAAGVALTLSAAAWAGPHGPKHRAPSGPYTGPVAPGPTAPANAVILFEHGDYRGASQVLTPGRYDRPSLRFGHDRLSALRVPPGMRVTLYEHGDFRGRTLTVTVDTPWLPGDFDDVTSAIAVEQLQPLACAPPPPCPVCPQCPPAAGPPRHPERQTPLPPPHVHTPPPVMAPPPPAPVLAPPPPQAMGEVLFKRFAQRVRDASFPKAQIAAVRDEVRVGSRFDTRQVIAIMEIISFPDHQVDACVEMWPAVVDPQNAPDVIGALSFESHRNRLRKALRL